MYNKEQFKGDEKMKIRTNYDLFEIIAKSKRGISLKREIKIICNLSLANATLFTFITTSLNLLNQNVLEKNLERLPAVILFHSIFNSVIPNIFLKQINKELANNELDMLASKLYSLNINTNRELLLNSYKYKTTYKLQKTQKAIPCIKREKYIMVPTNDIYEEEASLLEEHIMGTRKYDLSKGEPQKVLKLAKQFA